MTTYERIAVPAGADQITLNADFSLSVPDNPIVPYIEGDGIGADVTPVMLSVVNAAVLKAYDGHRHVRWMQVFAGENAHAKYGPGHRSAWFRRGRDCNGDR